MDCYGAASPLDTPSNGQPTIGRPFYVQAKGQLRLTCAFYAECAHEGLKGSEGSEGSACLWQAGSERKVLRMNRPTAGGFLSLTGPLAPRVVVSPLRAMSIKSALRDLPFCVIGHNKHSADWLAALAIPPYPATPDFPRKRGKNKANA